MGHNNNFCWYNKQDFIIVSSPGKWPGKTSLYRALVQKKYLIIWVYEKRSVVYLLIKIKQQDLTDNNL